MFLAGDAFLDAITIVYFYFQKKTKVDHLSFLFLFVFGIAGKKNSLVAENKIDLKKHLSKVIRCVHFSCEAN